MQRVPLGEASVSFILILTPLDNTSVYVIKHPNVLLPAAVP
jgi:hypothetical protein